MDSCRIFYLTLAFSISLIVSGCVSMPKKSAEAFEQTPNAENNNYLKVNP